MGYERFPSAANVNALVSPQYVAFPSAASVNAFGTGQYGTFPEGAIPQNPSEAGGANLILWFRADLGAGANQWNDQSSGGFNLTEATNPPTLNASGGPNNQAFYSGDGTNDRFDNATFNAPAPGTTPMLVWWIFRQVSWTANDEIFTFGGGSREAVRQTTSSPNVSMLNTTAVNENGGAAVGTWVRGVVLWTNSASDYLKLGSTLVAGANAGASDPIAGLNLFSRAGTNFGNVDIAEFAAFNISAASDSQMIRNLDAYCTQRYGAGLV